MEDESKCRVDFSPIRRLFRKPQLLSGILATLLAPKLGWKGRILAALLVILCGAIIVDKLRVREETFEALVRIDPVPYTQELVEQEQYAKAFEYLSYFMGYDYVKSNPEAVTLYEEIQAKRTSYRYRLQKAAEGLFYGQSDEIEGQISAVTSDFFLFGDVRDLVLEGHKWWNDKEVDKITVALSSIGLVASAGTAISAGSSASVQPALSFLKMANKVDMLPAWLRKYLLKSARIVKETKKPDQVTDLFDVIYGSYKACGMRGTLLLVNKADDVNSLKKLSKLGKKLGDKTAVFIDITGSSGLKLANRLDDMPKDVVLEASTFGKRGVDMLKQSGANRFLKFLQKTKGLAIKSCLAWLLNKAARQGQHQVAFVRLSLRRQR